MSFLPHGGLQDRGGYLLVRCEGAAACAHVGNARDHDDIGLMSRANSPWMCGDGSQEVVLCNGILEVVASHR
eukprot:3807665-Prymnesium_polylepis.2